MNILYVTTIGSTMGFFREWIKNLIDAGNVVDIACNFEVKGVPECYKEWGCKIFSLSCVRSPFSKKNLTAIKEIKKLVEENGYEIVHCHTPIAAVCTRFACINERKKGTKVFYTAHGFHFYKGAPMLNWMVFYPVEKFCSRFTDKLITINKEDFELAKTKFHAKEVHYIPGVGVDLSRFENVQVDRNEKRREIGVPEDAVLLFSVGELNENKNHQIIVKALAKLDNPNIHYAIAGVGDKKDYLLNLAKELGVSEQLHLLGYRKDIPELNHCADIFCFPSKREGLGIAAIEAMACGLPIITSNVHGINDYSMNGVTGFKFDPNKVNDCCNAVSLALNCNKEQMAEFNKEYVKKYSVDKIIGKMKNIYES